MLRISTMYLAPQEVEEILFFPKLLNQLNSLLETGYSRIEDVSAGSFYDRFQLISKAESQSYFFQRLRNEISYTPAESSFFDYTLSQVVAIVAHLLLFACSPSESLDSPFG